MSWYFNVSTGKVETDVDHSRVDNLLGPYATEAEAARALETARERTQAWDEEDRREAQERGDDVD